MGSNYRMHSLSNLFLSGGNAGAPNLTSVNLIGTYIRILARTVEGMLKTV